MATKIIHKKSSVANRIPVSADLEVGEIALNLADQKIYSKQTDGTVVEMSPNPDQLALIETCKNVSGGSLAIGTPVYQVGTSGNAMEVQAARADTAGSMPAVGILSQTLADEAEGTLVLTGFVQGLDTSTFSEGDTLYIAATGGLTNTPPAGESNLIQNIGKVIKVHASNGSIMVTGAGRANATPNLDDGKVFVGNTSNQSSTEEFKFQNLRDVTDYTPSNLSAGDILIWDDQNDEWKPSTPSAGTINENLTNWEFDSGSTWDIEEVGNSVYFKQGSTSYMKLDSSGNLEIAGDITSNATISGASSTSLYFTFSGTKYMELTTAGDLFVAGDITSAATIS